MDFADRLVDYRKNVMKIKTQTEAAKILGINRQLFSNLENRTKTPSKAVIQSLVDHSNLPEEYWLYGINPEEYVNERKDFKCLYEAIERLSDTNLLDLDENDQWITEVEKMLLYALKADITHIRLRDKNKKTP